MGRRCGPLQRGQTRLRGLTTLNGSRMMSYFSTQLPAQQGQLAIALRGSSGTEVCCFGSCPGPAERGGELCNHCVVTPSTPSASVLIAGFF